MSSGVSSAESLLFSVLKLHLWYGELCCLEILLRKFVIKETSTCANMTSKNPVATVMQVPRQLDDVNDTWQWWTVTPRVVLLGWAKLLPLYPELLWYDG